MFQAAIFDMDGLMIDSEPIWRRVEVEVFKSVDFELTEELLLQCKGRRLDEVTNYLYSVKPWSGKSKAEIQEAILAKMETAIGTSSELLPGVAEAISLFRSKGLKTAIASSSPYRLINAMVSRFSLDTSFEAIHSAQEDKLGKPDPAVYLTAAKKLGVEPSKCAAIEDSLAGLRSAKAAGMYCILVPEFGQKLPGMEIADMLLSSLTELKQHAELFR